MAARVVDDVVAVATSPARLAGVMNLLHRGLLADPVAEERFNEVLGRADCDVLTLTRDAGYVPDEEDACTLTLAGADAGLLLGIVEELRAVARRELHVVRCADVMSTYERTVMEPFYASALEALGALSGDLVARSCRADWAVLVELTVRDDHLLVYHEQVVRCGPVVEAATAALKLLLRGGSLANATHALAALGGLTEAVELSSQLSVSIGGGRERIAALRIELARIDSETLELLEQERSDERTRRELFDSAKRPAVAQERRLSAALLVA